MNVLAVTNLFPNIKEPGRGLFNLQQFIELKSLCNLKVIAPLPWTPSFIDSIYNFIPREESVGGIYTFHPRYLVTPKIGRRFYGYWYYLSIFPLVKQILREWPVDLIYATWGYPDCYGAALMARKLSIPLVSRVHGTDVNVGATNPARKTLMKFAFEYSYKVITNSSGLKTGVEKIGIEAEKVTVLSNGVDTNLFKPKDKRICREKLNFDPAKKHVLFIGNLVDVKGVKYLVKAMVFFPEDVVLHILGSGDLEANLKGIARQLRVSSRIYFHGRKPHNEIPNWLSATDVLCLPSINEGCPNVVLESLACGTPVAASDVGALPDLIDNNSKGRLFPVGTPELIAKKIKELFTQNEVGIKPEYQAISWKENARSVYELFKEIAER